MFLHLGRDYVIKEKDIIGIFDIDNTSSFITKKFFKLYGEQGKIIEVSDELPKSAVIVNSELGGFCYISQLSTATLRKRLNGKNIGD